MQDWTCLFSDEFSISTKVHLYQAMIRSVLLYGAETWTLLVADMNTLEAFHVRCQRLMYAGGLMSPMQRCFRDLVCQPLVTSCIIDAYLCLAMLYAWILECQHMMLCIWWWIPMKAEGQWPAGEDHRATLATSGSTRSRRMPTVYCYLRCGDLRSPGVMERSNGPIGLCNNDLWPRVPSPSTPCILTAQVTH